MLAESVVASRRKVAVRKVLEGAANAISKG